MTPVERLLAKLPDAKRVGRGWSARCPAHDDSRASLSIGEGNAGRAIVKCHAGCKFDEICASVGLRGADLMPAAEASRTTRATKSKRRIIARYDYRDETGTPLFQVLRYDPKDFRQRRPKPSGGWDWSIKGVRVVPYRLPDLLADPDRPIVVVEGEKDCDSLARIGVLATCNAGGAGKWTAEHAAFLRGRWVVILPDNDEAGRNHAQQVAQSLYGAAEALRVVELPGLPSKADVSDWIAAGGTKDELVWLVEAAPDWMPNATAVQAQECKPEPPQYVPFPTDLLPSPAREFVEGGSEALGCDPAYVALPLLAALSSAVGNARRVELKKSWCEPCVLWTVIIGESGTLKSPALDLALEPLRRRQTAAYREYENALREHERWSQMYEADLAEWKKNGRKKGEPAPEKPELPTWRQILAEDTTVEALAVLLENQPRGLLVARDELAGWLNSFDAYKSARGADVAHWLSMHRAGSLLVNRKTGRNLIRVPRAAVCVCGGVQPRTLAAALAGRYSADGPEQMDKPPSEHFANGLAARLLLAYPERIPKQWTDADIGDDIRQTIRLRFNDLFSLEAPTDEFGELVPVDLPLTAEAKRRYIAFYNANASEQCDLEADLAAAWAKVEGYAARLALLWELVSDPEAQTVSDTAMEAGIGLARWFVDEAARIYRDLGGTGDDSETRAYREQQRLAEWIRDHDGAVTVRDLTRGPRQFRGDSKAAEAALNRLLEGGYGHWESSVESDSGGRPTRIFVLANNGDGDETPQNADNDEDSSPSPSSPGDPLRRVQVTI
jgi:hypothetical protein